MNKTKKDSSLEDKAASIKPNKFFKNKERTAARMESQSLSSLYKSWVTTKKSPTKVEGKRKYSRPPVRTKTPSPPAIPVFNGNFENAPDIKKTEGKPQVQLIDLCDKDLGPRSGFVSPHQVGFQVNDL